MLDAAASMLLLIGVTQYACSSKLDKLQEAAAAVAELLTGKASPLSFASSAMLNSLRAAITYGASNHSHVKPPCRQQYNALQYGLCEQLCGRDNCSSGKQGWRLQHPACLVLEHVWCKHSKTLLVAACPHFA